MITIPISIQIAFTPQAGINPEVTIEGWNVDKQRIELKQETK